MSARAAVGDAEPTGGVVPQQRLDWFTQGEAGLLAALSGPAADRIDLRAPSRLPGWSGAHVVAHLIGNAAALGNLVQWARTGEPTPMYTGPQARARQIERDAVRDDAWLLETCAASSHELSAAVGRMEPADWASRIRTATGREVTAAEIPWLRTRESVIHRLDLGLSWSLPSQPDLVDALLSDTVATVSARPGCPAVLLLATDRDHRWALGALDADGSETEPLEVKGEALQLLRWIIGRPPTGGDEIAGYPREAPILPRWL